MEGKYERNQIRKCINGGEIWRIQIRKWILMVELLEKFKSGFVSMVEQTNVGKSSIINALVGEKVAAIANKPQTTRTAIRAIVNRKIHKLFL